MTQGSNVNNNQKVKNEYVNLSKKQVISTGNKELLSIFNSSDSNQNGVLDSANEVSLFGQKAAAANYKGLEKQVKSQNPNQESGVKVAQNLSQGLDEGVESNQFQKALKSSLHGGNIVAVLDSYQQKNNKSLVADIIGKRFQSNEARQESINHVYNKVMAAAVNNGHDKKKLGQLQQEFRNALDEEFESFGMVDEDRIEALLNKALFYARYTPEEQVKCLEDLKARGEVRMREFAETQMQVPSDAIASNLSVVRAKRAIDIQQEVLRRSEEARTERINERKTWVKDSTDTQSVMSREEGLKAFNDIYGVALGNFNEQLKKDGFAGDVADGISYIWNNPVGEALGIATGNTAKEVRADLSNFAMKINMLEEAAQTNNFEAEFEKQFGRQYEKAKVDKLIEAKEKLSTAAATVTLSDMAEQKLGRFASVGRLPDAFLNTMDVMPKGGCISSPGSRNQPEVSYEDFRQLQSNLEEFLGEKSLREIETSYLTKQMQSDLSSGKVPKTTLSDSEKYRLYCRVSSSLVDQFKDAKEKALDGKTLDEYAKNYNDSFDGVFGKENNVLKKVSEYIDSQETGAAVIKGATEAVIVVGGTAIIVVSGGTATPLVSAGLAAGASAIVDFADKASNDVDGDIDLKAISKKALVNGVLTFVGGKTSKYISAKIGSSVVGSKFSESVIKVGSDTFVKGSFDVGKDIINNGVDAAFDVRNLISRYACAYIKSKVSAEFAKGSWQDNVSAVGTKGGHAAAKKIGNDGAFKNEINEIKKKILEEAQQNNPEACQLASYMQANPQEFDSELLAQLRLQNSSNLA